MRSMKRKGRKVSLAGVLAGAIALAGSPAAAEAGGARQVELELTDRGFSPSPVKVEKGKPITLVVTRKTDSTCAKEIVVPGHDVKKKLPLNEPVSVTFTPDKAGELKYGCAMNQMVGGVLLVE